MTTSRTSRPLGRIPGTSRRLVIAGDGVELERSQVYMPAETWESLYQLAKAQQTSGSKVIAQLIEDAAKACQVNRAA